MNTQPLKNFDDIDIIISENIPKTINYNLVKLYKQTNKYLLICFNNNQSKNILFGTSLSEYTIKKIVKNIILNA